MGYESRLDILQLPCPLQHDKRAFASHGREAQASLGMKSAVEQYKLHFRKIASAGWRPGTMNAVCSDSCMLNALPRASYAHGPQSVLVPPLIGSGSRSR